MGLQGIEQCFKFGLTRLTLETEYVAHGRGHKIFVGDQGRLPATPSPDPSSNSAATCRARRVLPDPPAPVRVTCRLSSTSPLTSATSRARPTKRDDWQASCLEAQGCRAAQGREVVHKSVDVEPKYPFGKREVLQAVRSEIDQFHPSWQAITNEDCRGLGKTI